MSEALIEVHRLKKYYPVRAGLFNRTVNHVKAVDDISFSIYPGETFGLVGESGSGKSTAGRAILRLTDKTAGDIRYQGTDIHQLSRTDMRRLRPELQFIFQDPYSSLNPRMRIGDAIGEALLQHGLAAKEELRDRVEDILSVCGMAAYHYDRYPHEFSGGQRQRIGIARAIILEPRFIVADEPVSALDVSIQAQIINLFRQLQEERGLTYLFISHDLSVVEHLCSRIGVMYLGSLVELAPRDELFRQPLHPYTQALLSAIPIPDPKRKRSRIVLRGDIPSPVNPPSGCKFHTRCPAAKDICRQETPLFREAGSQHYAACHLI
ncbi:ABC transporter ATP-binding protein [Paenibacillus thiaminolyticus]|uniref:ABC transporter ATP-binding protein n=1 Tax=Paenibacillus thiaminolyticus TaxID=49283 RepID=A0AAP9J1H4_PANTH|nr:ABC transporter ATP-binding protein [Paenibacillus thiaminolyticus]MCY9533599.1 ABC transporter ATP-binding protein [Paenibacillus thiaminolyticus]MCY9600821.1 ABC transporter ATP-binding protein [Paenibacillus thiaminolyticus]MCY9607649.1 ABC transporter ATP-binding protein [Paenibacillus thiaminolyticus]MCY9611449.1 ABC transporter ATP-binding protein [Paenibacillus thiaminolyticus]MCY9617280.1 ABC transporter ATP-binding protein [Paenibacillus thiaminolyticus]